MKVGEGSQGRGLRTRNNLPPTTFGYIQDLFAVAAGQLRQTQGVASLLRRSGSTTRDPWTHLNLKHKHHTLKLGAVTSSLLQCRQIAKTLSTPSQWHPAPLEKGNYGLLSGTQRNCTDAPPIRENCNFKHALFNDAARSVQLTLENTLAGQSQECPAEPWGNISAFRKISDFFEHAWYKSCSGLFIILTVEQLAVFNGCFSAPHIKAQDI